MAKISGGVTEARDVRAYKPPKGPSSINNPKSPGLHGNVYERGTQSISGFQGKPSGKAGLGGTKKPSGSQRC